MLSSAMADLPAWLRVALVLTGCIATFVVTMWLVCYVIGKSEGDNPEKENDDEQ